MKKNNTVFYSRNILSICFLIIFVVILLFSVFFKKNLFNKSNNNINSNYLISFKDTNLNKKLDKYLRDEYSVSISKVNGNFIYGDIHDTSTNNDLFTTKNIFSYNYKEDKLEIYDFNYNYRILNYYFYNNSIYAALVFENKSNNIGYCWSIIKFNNSNFKEGKILKEGYILDPISTPVFYYSNDTKDLYVISINENFEIVNEVINKRYQQTNIYRIDDSNNSLVSIKEYNGDYLNKSGTMLCSIFDIQIYKNELLFCTTDYINYQEIKTINLNDYSENKIFSIDLKDNWIITSFQRNKEGIFLNKRSMNDNTSGKTSFYNIGSKETKELDSRIFYGRNSAISNYILFHDYEEWSLYDTTNNKFYSVKPTGKYKQEYFYPTFYILNENEILVKGNNNYFYIGTIRFD